MSWGELFLPLSRVPTGDAPINMGFNGNDRDEEVRTLTKDEERGLADALESLRAGQGRTIDRVRAAIEAKLRR